MRTIGERIKALRKRENLSGQQLAEIIGKSKGNISGYENGKFEPSAQTIAALCRYFRISADWLLFGDAFQNENGPPGPLPADSEQKLLDVFRRLSPQGREEVISFASYKRAMESPNKPKAASHPDLEEEPEGKA